MNRYHKKPAPTHIHDEEEGFTQTTRSIAWELVGLGLGLEPVGLGLGLGLEAMDLGLILGLETTGLGLGQEAVGLGLGLEPVGVGFSLAALSLESKYAQEKLVGWSRV